MSRDLETFLSYVYVSYVYLLKRLMRSSWLCLCRKINDLLSSVFFSPTEIKDAGSVYRLISWIEDSATSIGTLRYSNKKS